MFSFLVSWKKFQDQIPNAFGLCLSFFFLCTIHFYTFQSCGLGWWKIPHMCNVKGKLWTTLSPLCVFCETNRPVLAVFSVASVVEDLRAALSKLECRVAVLEKSPAAVTPAASTCSVPYTNVRLYLLISAQIFPALLLLAPVRFLWFFLTLLRALVSSRRAALQ